MGIRRRGPSRGEHKRDQIRQGAYQCFRDQGYHDTTVDDICRTVQISKGSFYWHYDTKQMVFIDILEVWSREVMDELYEQFEQAVVTDDYLVAITHALERELHRGRALAPLWIEFNALAKRDHEVQEALSKFYRRARTAIAEILRPVMEDRFSDAELRSVATTIFGAYLGLLMQEQVDAERADAQASVHQFMGVVGGVFQRLPADYRRPEPARREERPSRADERLRDDHLADALEAAPAAVRAKVSEVRGELLARWPQLSERLTPARGEIAYRCTADVLILKPVAAGLQLAFPRGAALVDPQGLLSGRGKGRRTLILGPGATLGPAVLALIEQAVDADARS